jgi:hypothetical protein
MVVAFGGERDIYLFTYILLGFYHWIFSFLTVYVCYLRVEKEEEENPPRERERERERERDLLSFYADNTESERRASHIL